MARKLNYPVQQQPNIEPDKLALMVSSMAELQGMPPVQTDEEIAERLEFFFAWCSQKQLRPTVSLMSLCLGHPRQTLWNWQQRGGKRGELITRAKGVLEALTEQWMAVGKINPVSGIFLLKAQFGYRDVVTIETPVNNALTPQMTPDEIQKQIEADIPIYEE